ncbi:hypothetical protein [Persephonella sp.]|nr:hypothetical protein [Aquificota bacterium]
MGGRRQDIYLFLFFLFLTVEFSCARHTEIKPLEGADRIKVYEATDPAEKVIFEMKTKLGCRLVLKEIVIPPSIKEGTYYNADKEIEIIARNRAVETGGTVVVLETFKKIPEIQFDAKYTGKIIVMRCP